MSCCAALCWRCCCHLPMCDIQKAVGWVGLAQGLRHVGKDPSPTHPPTTPPTQPVSNSPLLKFYKKLSGISARTSFNLILIKRRPGRQNRAFRPRLPTKSGGFRSGSAGFRLAEFLNSLRLPAGSARVPEPAPMPGYIIARFQPRECLNSPKPPRAPPGIKSIGLCQATSSPSSNRMGV